MPFATRGYHSLRVKAHDSDFQLLRDLRDGANDFRDFSGCSIPTDVGYFSGRAADPQIADVGSNPLERDQVVCQHFLHYVVL